MAQNVSRPRSGRPAPAAAGVTGCGPGMRRVSRPPAGRGAQHRRAPPGPDRHRGRSTRDRASDRPRAGVRAGPSRRRHRATVADDEPGRLRAATRSGRNRPTGRRRSTPSDQAAVSATSAGAPRRRRRRAPSGPPSTSRYSSGHHGRIPARMYSRERRGSSDENVIRSSGPRAPRASSACPTPRLWRAGIDEQVGQEPDVDPCRRPTEPPNPTTSPSTSATTARARASRCSRYGQPSSGQVRPVDRLSSFAARIAAIAGHRRPASAGRTVIGRPRAITSRKPIVRERVGRDAVAADDRRRRRPARSRSPPRSPRSSRRTAGRSRCRRRPGRRRCRGRTGARRRRARPAAGCRSRRR